MSAFIVAVTGRYTGADEMAYQDPDTLLQPDMATLCLAPGAGSSKAYVLADAHHPDGRPWAVAPRHVLKSVIDLFRRRGWRAVVAPEMEFYLTAPNPDPGPAADGAARPLGPGRDRAASLWSRIARRIRRV